MTLSEIDWVIQKAANKSIQEIFEREGEVGFRELETQVLNEIGQRHSLVVATGGGIVTKPENWGILHQGVVIWIDPNREIVLSRLETDQSILPLLQNNQQEVFDALYKQRLPLYSESDLHISIDKETPEEVSCLILDRLKLILIEKEGLNEQQTIAD